VDVDLPDVPGPYSVLVRGLDLNGVTRKEKLLRDKWARVTGTLLHVPLRIADSAPCHVLYDPNGLAYNPANPGAVSSDPHLTYALVDHPSAGPWEVTVEIYDVEDGSLVKSKVVTVQNPGPQEHTWAEIFEADLPGQGIYAWQVEAVNRFGLSDHRLSKSMSILGHQVTILDEENDAGVTYQIQTSFQNDTARGPALARVTVYDYDLAVVTQVDLTVTGQVAEGTVMIPHDRAAGARFVVDAQEPQAEDEQDVGKWVRERNWRDPNELHIWGDGLNNPNLGNDVFWYGPHLEGQNNVEHSFQVCARLSNKAMVHRPDYTQGPEGSRWLAIGGATVRFNTLSPQQQGQSRIRTVIVTDYPWAVLRPGVTEYGDEKYRPSFPALSVISGTALQMWWDQKQGGDLSSEDLKWARTNAAIHEITHVATGGGQGHSPATGQCVWDEFLKPHFYDPIVHTFNAKDGKELVTIRDSPWHTLADINQIRRSLGFKQLSSP
jgi:hypothetical protein